ncbi:EamA family transporter RarD [Paenibacillus gansuensis]|uniref:EamA family transporter RarD n=1 Tax=Paenibacillus gansuensis TaxID=306542 RepID=A0ABW5PF08_9BACL
MTEHSKGTAYAAGAYLLWGLLPIYWKVAGHVPSDQILAHRVFWACILMLALLGVSRKWTEFTRQLKDVLKHPAKLLSLTAASLLISINWFVYIWAVNSGHLVESSMGYYINPLVSVLLGMFVLKEKLNTMQWVSFALAAAGVLILTIRLGNFPWIAITLAVSFGLYGLAKKLTTFEASIGLTMETLIVTPLAAAYLIWLSFQGKLDVGGGEGATLLLLVGSGAATAAPLLLFALGAQRIPLSLIGFLQYIAPTISLILGVFVYGETFSHVHLIAFLFIWASLAVFTLSRTGLFRRAELKS